MKVVLQRVRSASVKIEGNVVGEIKQGLLILVGFESEDNETDISWMSNKIVQLRIFSDEEGKMNDSLVDFNGEVLVVSQFTLHGSIKKGKRPSFVKAARPEIAIPLYEAFKKELSSLLVEPLQSGQFGADMQVELINDGPVTIVIDSKNRV